jgi:predicted Zn-ribbon and HTH transcriptional regulator/ribosomal protein L34
VKKKTNHSQTEVSDIVRHYLSKVSNKNHSVDQLRVLHSVVNCRTAVLGGHQRSCTSCGYKEQSYNSCLNRHCPKCKGGAVFDWIEARQKELLEVPYFHVVFTTPSELKAIFFQNKKVCYDLLFQAATETLHLVAKNNKGVTLGYFGVLHTWNQELQYFPHLHFVVPGCGLTKEKQFKSLGNSRYFLPVKVLSKVYQGKLIFYLKKAYADGKLKFFNNQTHLDNPQEFNHQMSRATRQDWVVYAKPPFAGPQAVVRYLSSYTHRVGISNHRIRKVTDTHVSFSARHKTKPGKKILVTISIEDFIRRFMLHILPSKYRRVRHYGFLCNSEKAHSLETLKNQRITATSVVKKALIQCPQCKISSFTSYLSLKAHRPGKILEFRQNPPEHPPPG